MQYIYFVYFNMEIDDINAWKENIEYIATDSHVWFNYIASTVPCFR